MLRTKYMTERITQENKWRETLLYFVFAGTLAVSRSLLSNAAGHPIKLFVDEVDTRCARRPLFLPLFGSLVSFSTSLQEAPKTYTLCLAFSSQTTFEKTSSRLGSGLYSDKRCRKGVSSPAQTFSQRTICPRKRSCSHRNSVHSYLLTCRDCTCVSPIWCTSPLIGSSPML